MKRTLIMKRIPLVAKWVIEDAYCETESRTRRGAAKCPALLATLRNTNDAAGEPLSLEAARAVLRGEG